MDIAAVLLPIQAKRQRVKSDPDSTIRSPSLAVGPSQALLDEASRLNNRAEELNTEIQNRPMFSSQKRPVDINTALQDRVLILELSQLVNDFQRLIKKLIAREKCCTSANEPLICVPTGLLDGDRGTAGKLPILQVRSDLVTYMRGLSRLYGILRRETGLNPSLWIAP